MSSFDAMLTTVPDDVREAIEEVCDEAGTFDADWCILKAAGELIVKSRTLPPVSPEDLVEGERYLVLYENFATKQMIEYMMFWISGEWRTTNNKYRQIVDCINFVDEPIQIYGPLRFNIGGAK